MCRTNKGFANIYRKKCLLKIKKRSFEDTLFFYHTECKAGEKYLMGHCH